MKFLKREIREMRQAITSWWLVNRPLHDSKRLHAEYAAWAEQKLSDPAARMSIIRDGIEQMRGIIADRMEQNEKTAAHARANPKVWGSGTDEIVERFTKLAAGCKKSVDKADALLRRLTVCPLPEQVTSYRPWSEDA